MTELITAKQMQALEQAAIEAGQVSGLELMERAGKGVVEAIFEEWPDLALTSHRAVVLCGPGNNGGDGFVIARLLKEWGWEVFAFLYANPNKLPPDALVNFHRFSQLGVVHPWSVQTIRDICMNDSEPTTLLVDALFGTGILRDLPAEIAALQQEGVLPERIKRVSVDLPSGLCSDSGKTYGGKDSGALQSALTVTFHTPKLGHFLCDPNHPDGKSPCTDKVVVKDIGLKGPAPREGVTLLQAPVGQSLTKSRGHKYEHGHLLVLSGGAGRTGAARLAARAAVRVGAGLVTLGVPASAQLEVACQITAIMLTRAGTTEELSAALEDRRINAICLGPGLGQRRARALVPLVLGHAGKPCVVLDADGLSAFEHDPEALFDLLQDNCVLTPHAGEFGRLFPDLAAKMEASARGGALYSKVDAAREAAQRAGCVILLKGADTVIAQADGRCSLNAALYERAAPWLATAGAGDVLAGFIAGLLARGFAPMAAAEAGAWLHVACALSFGPGLIAEDLPEELPKVLRQFGPMLRSSKGTQSEQMRAPTR